ncbi:GntR family transcriptional regulator [Curtobacterium ammoniigenes]|uniref:GntR family transcriptional regulator n=1 Tax=Curtobacterium ammoniigenes TaxID=395387 RepID=UPI0009F91D5B|nr:GntR family transcriptional regulator [Curtobacterium ammoniigenes]
MMSAAESEFPVVGRRMLADEVYERLLEILIDGRIPADAPVSIDGMARQLAVSPTPVREALARLEATGLVHRVALKGYRVAPILTPEELGKLMDARRIIEGANARIAASTSDPTFVEELGASIRALEVAPHGPGFAELRPYWRADEQFHRLIALRADNPFLLHAFEALGGQVQRFRLYGRSGVTDAAQAVAEHSAILDALRRNDEDAAAAAMEAHITEARRRALRDREEKLDERARRPEHDGGVEPASDDGMNSSVGQTP